MNCLRHELRARIGGCNSSIWRGLQSKLREFMKRSFNSWRSQFMERFAQQTARIHLSTPSFRADESSIGAARYGARNLSTAEQRSRCFNRDTKKVWCTVKAPKPMLLQNGDPSRQSQAARVKPCGAQDDEGRRAKLCNEIRFADEIHYVDEICYSSGVDDE